MLCRKSQGGTIPPYTNTRASVYGCIHTPLHAHCLPLEALGVANLLPGHVVPTHVLSHAVTERALWLYQHVCWPCTPLTHTLVKKTPARSHRYTSTWGPTSVSSTVMAHSGVQVSSGALQQGCSVHPSNAWVSRLHRAFLC